uniref:Uncharacterized protein n=1 Tax=Utricularia reniformis TaxID=192314 RepID=A0A1Y0B318_9LAMI|nr:hypothetical protein AEK19_MT1652 [Utricularia reniformis]ART31836.1 hypothetical protein AEK19_MT1652 [Utricularia reniformis]
MVTSWLFSEYWVVARVEGTHHRLTSSSMLLFPLDHCLGKDK